MSTKIKLGKGNWGVKENGLLAYNDEDNIFKAIEMNHSRSSVATRVNSAGLVAESGIGVPRIDFQDDANGALLLEPSRTNLITYSEDFSQWTLSNSGNGQTPILTSNYTTYKGLNASRIVFSRTSASFSNISSIRGNDYTQSTNTFSIYIKSNESNVNIDFRLGSSVVTYEITTEWKRMEFTGSDFYRSYFGLLGSNSDLYADLSIVAAQAEQGSYATSYIPTSGAIATRIADTCSKSGLENYINSSEGVLYVEFSRFGFDSSIQTEAMGFRNSLNVSQIRFHFDYPNKTIRWRDGLNGNATIGGFATIEGDTPIKAALNINGSTLKSFVNGSQVGSDYTRPTPFDIGLIYFGNSAWKLKDLRVYDTALTDAELQALTS